MSPPTPGLGLSPQLPTELLLCKHKGAKCALQVPHGLALRWEGRGAPSTKGWAAERLPSCTSRLPASFRVPGGLPLPKGVFNLQRKCEAGSSEGWNRCSSRCPPLGDARRAGGVGKGMRMARWRGDKGRLPAPHWLWIRGLFILLQQFKRHRFPQAKPELGAGAGGCQSRPGVRRHQAWGAMQGHREPPHSPPGDQKCNLGLQDSSPLSSLPPRWKSTYPNLVPLKSVCKCYLQGEF